MLVVKTETPSGSVRRQACPTAMLVVKTPKCQCPPAGLSNISTWWRTPGMKKKVRRKVNELFPAEPAAHKIMSKVPGRCLRGRWGSVHDVESIVLPAWPYLGDILVSLVPWTFEVPGDTGNQIVPSGSGTGMQQYRLNHSYTSTHPH